MKNIAHRYHKQRGLSIIELMISIFISMILISGVITLFVSNRDSYTVQDGLARIQEAGRYVQSVVSQAGLGAGYEGCSNLNITVPNNLITPSGSPTTGNAAINFTTTGFMAGYEGGGGSGSTGSGAWSPALPSWVTANVAAGTSIRPGTDVLITQLAGPQSVYLTANMTTTTDGVTIPNTLAITTGDTVIISDCQSADIFRVTGVSTSGSNVILAHSTASNTTANLSKAYQTDAQVSRITTNAYYIKNTGRTNTTGLPIYAFYRQNGTGSEDELAEGVEDMQITYRTDTDNNDSADTTGNASAATSWNQLKGMDFSFLLDTVDEVNNRPQAYFFRGTSITPTDRMLRREWGFQVSVRNRTL